MRELLKRDILALIARLAHGQTAPDERDALLLRIAAYQRAQVTPYARLCDRRAHETAPALPTDVFRYVRIAGFPESEEVGAFLTSGTSSGVRGRHPHKDLELYRASALAAARCALFPDVERIKMVMLAPSPTHAPESSLSYMLGLFAQHWGSTTHWVFEGQGIDWDALGAALEGEEPVALLGTSFAFVHVEDGVQRRFTLPTGSRVMQTGGYKGRSREVAPDVLRSAIAARFGVDERFIVSEYGMTELSSQMYEDTLMNVVAGRDAAPRRLWVPGWMRVSSLDPETLAPTEEVGLLRFDDPANLDTVSAIVTADMGRCHPDGRLTLLGRASGARPRGCSLAVEEALGDW